MASSRHLKIVAGIIWQETQLKPPSNCAGDYIQEGRRRQTCLKNRRIFLIFAALSSRRTKRKKTKTKRKTPAKVTVNNDKNGDDKKDANNRQHQRNR